MLQNARAKFELRRRGRIYRFKFEEKRNTD
jgi:hypothetical protein